MFLPGLVAIAGGFFASYATSYWAFVLLYGVTIGIVNGFTYITTVYLAWQYFPGKEGTISGVIIAGYGFGSCFFTYLAEILVNPDSVAPIDTKGDPNLKPFPPEIAANVPKTFRIVHIVGFVLLTITVLLL